MRSQEFITTLKKDLTNFLYQLDPTQVGTVENELYDEYENEASMIVDNIHKEILLSMMNDDFSIEDLKILIYYELRMVFETQYTPLTIFDLFNYEELKTTIHFLGDKIWQEI